MPVAEDTAVRAQLGSILSSPLFAKSPRMSRFLRFVVERTLEGKAGEIKEYVVAIEVFDKSHDYDPQADSTVRTEASKLRSRLARYYETEGRNDAIHISIPKGTYVPVFEECTTAVVPAPAARLSSWLLAAGAAACAAIAFLLWFNRSIPASTPLPQPLTSYPQAEEHPSLSPDGTRVAFRWKDDIYVKQIGSEAPQRISRQSGADWPAWSPDGRQLAFVRGGAAFVVSADGGAENKVAESAGRIAWTPDGAALFVLQTTSRYARSIFRVTLATGEKRRMTFPDDHSSGDLDLAVSPDGRRLAICATLSGEGCDLYVKDLPDGEVRRLTDDRHVIQGLAWTPDGREIVFASNRRGVFRLWRIDAARSKSAAAEPMLLEGAGDNARFPSVAGDQLVYERYSWNFDIARAEIVTAKGLAPRLGHSQPLINSTSLDVSPAWSPDGRRIAFVSDRSGTREIWICEADGSNPRKLTSFGGPHTIYPRWSPDGTRLVFSAVTGQGGNFEGYVIAAAGGKAERIQATGRPTMAHPIFSHDGRWIYFIPGPKQGSVHAWKMPAGGGDALQVTAGDAFRPEESADGTMLYYGRPGVPGIWSTPTGGGDERQVLTSVSDRNWTVTANGIYYFDRAATRDSRTPLMFHDFTSKKTVQAGTVEAKISEDFSAISVSPDGRWLLYSHIANIDSDLMLLNHLRW